MTAADHANTRDPLTVVREMAYDLCGDDNGTTHPKCREIFDTVAALDVLEAQAESHGAAGWARAMARAAELEKRAEAAEAELAQFRALEPFAKLYADSQAERDRLEGALLATRKMRDATQTERDRQKKRAEAAEAERDQLADAAKIVLDAFDNGDDLIDALWQLRAALARTEDTP